MVFGMRFYTTRVDVDFNQARMAQKLGPTGPVADVANDVVRDAARSARARAPIGTGTLQRAIGYDRAIQSGPKRLTAGFGIDEAMVRNPETGYAYARAYLQGHRGSAGGRIKPVGATMVGRGMAFGQVNRKPGRFYSRKRPVMFSQKKFDGWEGNNFLIPALNAALVKNGFPPVG